MRPAIMAAKLDRLLLAMADVEDLTRNPGGTSMADIRRATAETYREIAAANGAVVEVNGIPLPSERVGNG